MGRIASCLSSSLHRLSWLILASDPASSPGHHPFYSLATGTTRILPVPESADSVENRCFSPKGWLLVVTRKLSMFLVDPFRCVQFALPDGSDGSLDDIVRFAQKPPKSELFPEDVTKVYLVDSDGKLLVVFRKTEENEEPFTRTSIFCVLQLSERQDVTIIVFGATTNPSRWILLDFNVF